MLKWLRRIIAEEINNHHRQEFGADNIHEQSGNARHIRLEHGHVNEGPRPENKPAAPPPTSARREERDAALVANARQVADAASREAWRRREETVREPRVVTIVAPPASPNVAAKVADAAAFIGRAEGKVEARSHPKANRKPVVVDPSDTNALLGAMRRK